MRHFRMPNQNPKDIAILQKHIGSILREINKYEEEDKNKHCSFTHKRVTKTGGIKKIKNTRKRNTRHVVRGKCLDETYKHNKTPFNPEHQVKRRCFLCKSCNVTNKTKISHLKHLNTHQYSPVSCKKCRKTFRNGDSFEWHWSQTCSLKDLNKNVYKCIQCFREFKAKKDIATHLEGHRRNNCPYCSKPITRRRVLIKHLIEIHSARLDISRCEICGKRYVNKRNLYRHSQQHLKDKVVCLECGNVSSTIGESEQHRLKHSEQKRFRCTICYVKFYRKHDYSYHMRAHDKYVCITCNESYGSRARILEHKQQGHIIEGLHPKFFCPYCNHIFHKKVRIQAHLKKHTETNSVVSCKYCNMSFGSISAFFVHCVKVSHVKYLLDLGKFQCEICQKKFLLKYLLDKHKLAHHNVAKEPYKCQHCNYKTYSKTNYERHQEVHNKEENSFICEQCAKMFSTVASLQGHISYSHLQDKKFTCECGKAFKRTSELKRHQATHSDNRPFVCNLCGAAFKRTTHLKRHEKSVHYSTDKKSNSRKTKKSQINLGNRKVVHSEVEQCLLNTISQPSTSYSLQPIHYGYNMPEDLRFVMPENLEEVLMENIDASYDLLANLTADDDSNIDILDLTKCAEFN